MSGTRSIKRAGREGDGTPPSRALKRGPKRKLDEDHWFEAALDAMAIGGVERVRIDRLAADLGVTKGSFYVLFRSREAFLDELLAHWRRISTLQVIAELSAINEPPLDRLARVFAISTSDRAKRRARIEAGFRLWAYDDLRASQTMREIDHHRLLYFQSVVAASGISADDARPRAFLIYSYLIGDAMLAAGQDDLREVCRAFLSTGSERQ
ncbi:hypothetical protein ATE67_02350 [Sphingopyxis sp. H050]|jgi:AcrR family transcriptional regulator|uniref:TetR/AcrR family transcriptional regulator n=1 Tax=Sphingopyxis sp. H050 TaxID=1759072 RepID=UPI00073660EC|nr:TetR/AcrR family transcriptional regulator [Sphingopyxis sp. H050]KTE22782.1 hypothetical protein ATE67_02350 [Sphingopyxis sp. H050]